MLPPTSKDIETACNAALEKSAQALVAESPEAAAKKRLTIVVFLIGPTCAGKSTFADGAKAMFPGHVATIRIGKAMRAKYPPEHFLGLGAPAHTQAEAQAIFNEEFKGWMEAERRPDMIVVDGIPRTVEQVNAISKAGKGWLPVFVHMMAPAHVLQARAEERHGDSPALDLALARIDSDRIAIHDIWPALATSDMPMVCVDTTDGVRVKEILKAASTAAEQFIADLAEQEAINNIMAQHEASQEEQARQDLSKMAAAQSTSSAVA